MKSFDITKNHKSLALQPPSVLQACIPITVLVLLLSLSVYLFGEDSSYGPNQIALCVGAAAAALVGWKNGKSWLEIEESIIHGITVAIKPLLILFCVGSLIGSWILSGTVPTMIYYSLLILDPSIFYSASCIICALIALSIGSSWTVAGTVGIALIGAAAGLGISLEITAGAIISGSYFGDKMSPLSETTNLAPAVAGTDLFGHIGHMIWTTFPSIVIALILFTVIGFNIDTSNTSSNLEITLQLLSENFSINVFMLVPVIMLLIMANKKFPPIPTILTGVILGILIALIFQQGAISSLSRETESNALTLFKGIWITLFDGFSLNIPLLNKLKTSHSLLSFNSFMSLVGPSNGA
mgnify:CR=1 FL=1